jgi:hypothetical protein
MERFGWAATAMALAWGGAALVAYWRVQASVDFTNGLAGGYVFQFAVLPMWIASAVCLVQALTNTRTRRAKFCVCVALGLPVVLAFTAT